MIPWNDKPTLRKADNPVLAAIKSCVVARGLVGKPITPAFLAEVSAALSRATRCKCEAYQELVLVPAAEGMVRVKVAHHSGQTWDLTAFRSPTLKGEVV